MVLLELVDGLMEFGLTRQEACIYIELVKNGSLTGYAGGIDKKVQLLKLEKTDMTGLFVPKKGTAL